MASKTAKINSLTKTEKNFKKRTEDNASLLHALNALLITCK